MQMLHCIEQVETKGGENTFTDSFRVSYDLKVNTLTGEHDCFTVNVGLIDAPFFIQKHDLETFNILSRTPVNFEDKNSESISFHMKTRRPIIA